ncbi:UBX domain-containing protein 1-A-like isoform X2 [Bradysia coprophila]|uniref:UBX domain-containing protein 1-A-like isoform X2 n=1 Tax=Bradysia coprophila TaxID=38358 RepID=UPI00187DAB6C|nr:UBX domain-containing protein 1-A-like isoform X2 [Bradysia coprophila]
MSELDMLISMGFSKERAEQALTETGNAGIELALEWMSIIDNCTIVKPTDSHFEEATHHQASHDALASNGKSGSSNTSTNSNQTTRILIRLLNGKQISKTFNASDRLNDVLLWTRSVVAEEFRLMTNFPKKIFTSEEYAKSLDELNLVPSAVLITTQVEKWCDLQQYRDTKNDDENRRVEEKRRKEEIEKRLKEVEEERLALERVRRQIEDDKARRRQRWPDLYQNAGQPSGNQLQLKDRSKTKKL